MKIYRICATVFICFLFLTGCQKNETVFEKEPTMDFASDINPNMDRFAPAGELQEEPCLWPTEYIPWEHEKDDNNSLTPNTVMGDRIYRLIRRTDKDNAGYQYFLEIYDSSSMQSAQTEIDDRILDMDGGFVADVNVINAETYAFLILKYEQDQADVFHLLKAEVVYTDLKEETNRVDLMPVIRENGLQDIHSVFYCDSLGNIYLRELQGNFVSNRLLIIDQNGSLWMDRDLGDTVDVRPPARTPEGELVFPINHSEEKTAQLVLFDSAKKEMCVLNRLNNESIEQIYSIQETALYYDSYDGIVKWDLTSGNRTLIFSFKQNSVSRSYNTMLLFWGEEPSVFRMYGNINGKEEDWLIPLSEQEPVVDETIQIVSLNGDSVNIRDCTALASRRNPGYSFKYKACAEKELEDFRTRTLADLIAGNGPDILYVSLEDMKLLQEMGALADLDNFLTAEMKEQILPGIIELGTIDETFVGIAPDASMHSAITLKSIWNQDTWSLEDVIGLMETGDYTGIFCQGTTTFTSYALFNLLTELGLEESSLINWETGESQFDSDLFRQILELAKVYGNESPLEADTWLGVGGCPGQLLPPDIESFNDFYEQYGDEYYYVGMPTKGDSGNYVTSNGVLVINKNASNAKAISAYLNSLFDEEIQYLNRPFGSVSILKVSLKDITTLEVNGETRFFWKNHRLQVKENGTTVLEDYKNFLESCIPSPQNYDLIIAIAWEESQSYLAGDKTADDVARIVDNRIQLYLDEGNGR